MNVRFGMHLPGPFWITWQHQPGIIALLFFATIQMCIWSVILVFWAIGAVLWALGSLIAWLVRRNHEHVLREQEDHNG